ncbi:DUF3012 domain-containing protein [Gilvimarinus algae]|uniref:DUF3012 domain-containing protein n=1 Tax=Gilvimarinus algae TaxID=3058037 RepID=A0ABT8TG29_9GAMM|nr:DUF3012 domain-containing protein [Gilvimarinus sp. SDUM040014]MDO3382479.1 DUF3012 domain-containing protein [Gilvimarinus sp. SDUM040014]
MSRSLVIAIIATIIGLATIAVGLYVLSQTPAPAPEATAQSSSAALVVVPQLESAVTDVPLGDAEPGSEAWCEAMMIKADNDWSDEESKLFAAQCIYQ